ncbi:MAG: amidohydrolase [Flavobacteriaceae bacterium]|nr:amidohydrolase [Flavobacteriaceae bacterium]
MKDQLNVVGIQADLVWEDPKANRNYFEKEIREHSKETDLIVLPEMFTTGFSMNASTLAEDKEGETLIWLQQMAADCDVALIGSIIYTENQHFFNRLFFVEPNGQTHTYDKRHTFTLAGEHEVYQSGSELLQVSYKGWQICPLICYDLRFPVWSRNTTDYDLLIYIASWPVKRVNAWDTLLQARAIENMSFVVGVNRIGKDANNYEYSGHSAIIDYLGESMSNLAPNQVGIVKARLEKKDLLNVREKLGFLNDRDQFTIE